jgi:hypothetical protein
MMQGGLYMADAGHLENQGNAPESWLNLPFDQTTNFSLLGYFIGASVGDHRLDLILDE